jgi:epoxyqueuosine reductase QueG
MPLYETKPENQDTEPNATATMKQDPQLLDRNLLEAVCREAGADDVGFVDLDCDAMAGQRNNVRRVLPWARTVMAFARRLSRNAIRVPLRSTSSAEFVAGASDIKATIHRTVRELEKRDIRAVGVSGLFPMEFGRTDGPPWLLQLKYIAEAAGLGIMGKNRLVLHPQFGPYMYLGAIVLDGQVGSYGQPLEKSPCLNCNLCAATCPTGAIAKDGHFDFGSCATHNYREKTQSFVEWVHTIADSRNRRDYARRVSDAETLSWWQSLAYDANTHCDYCVAVCPAGDGAASFVKNHKKFFNEIVRLLRDRVERVYVVPGSDAETYVSEAFPQKSVRRIGSGRAPGSVSGLIGMLPLVFQRGKSKGLAARYHFRFTGKETMEATVEIRDQKIKVDRGLIGDADLKVTADSEVWLRFLRKDCSFVWQVLTGHIQLSGSSKLLKSFAKCFPL